MADDDWGWLAPNGQLRLELNASMTFVRDIDVRAVVEAFGLDPNRPMALTAAEADPFSYVAPGEDEPRMLRVAQLSGGWTFTHEVAGVRAHVDSIADGFGRAGHETLMIAITAAIAMESFTYWNNNQWLTGGVLGQPPHAGLNPTLFDDALGEPDDTATGRVIAALNVFGRRLGISMDAQVFDSALPTFVEPRKL